MHCREEDKTQNFLRKGTVQVMVEVWYVTHVARECPGDGAEQQTRSSESYKPSDQGRTDGKIEIKGDYLN